MFAKVIKLILMMVELDDNNNIKIEDGCYEGDDKRDDCDCYDTNCSITTMIVIMNVELW
jgi:hypothetical protein